MTNTPHNYNVKEKVQICVISLMALGGLATGGYAAYERANAEPPETVLTLAAGAFAAEIVASAAAIEFRKRNNRTL